MAILESRGCTIVDKMTFVLGYKGIGAKLVGVLNADGSVFTSTIAYLRTIPPNHPTNRPWAHTSRGENWMTFVLKLVHPDGVIQDRPAVLKGYKSGHEIDFRTSHGRWLAEYGEARAGISQTLKTERSLDKIRRFQEFYPEYKGAVYDRSVYLDGEMRAAERFVRDSVSDQVTADLWIKTIREMDASGELKRTFHRFLKDTGLGSSMDAEWAMFERWLQNGFLPQRATDPQLYQRFCRFLRFHPVELERARELGFGKGRQRANIATVNRASFRPVVREDGTRYESLSAAARANGMNPSSLHEHIRKQTKACRGHRYRYA